MRVVVLGWLLVLGIWLGGCQQADLRPASLQKQQHSSQPVKARRLLKEAKELYQEKALVAWSKVSGVDFAMQDQFYGLTGWIIRPWPNNPQHLRFRFVPTQDKAVVYFKDEQGHKTSWGVHNWHGWRRVGDKLSYGNEQALFWLPTLEYFIEMPYRLGDEAEIVDYAGSKWLDGREYHLVYATWGSYAPHPQYDQYLIYIDKHSGLVKRVDFTVREKASFVTAAVTYHDFRRVEGFIFPFDIRIGSVANPGDLLHQYRVGHCRVGVFIQKREYAPRLLPPRSKEEAVYE